MRSIKACCAAFLFVIASAYSVSAFEMQEGRIKLVVNESSGRFSLYYLVDLQKNKYEALFVDQDPRTSFLALLVDDRPQRLGETSAFRVRTEKTDASARISFESSGLVVRQDFTFFKNAGSPLSDGVRIEISVENTSERELSVALRFLMDTKLGEKNPEPFSTDLRSIGAETLIVPAKDQDGWWYSKDAVLGIMGNIAVKDVRAPDSIQFANWKRMNDAPWKTEPSPGRNFNLLPYSIGDSALCYYFDPAPLARGAVRKETILLAVASNAGFTTPSAEKTDDLSRMLQSSVTSANAPELMLRTDLITVRDLLDKVNALLAAGGAVGDEELAALETVVARLKERSGIK
ncbi:MAG TPA: hypothetical protein DIC34_17785 [Treponema sp.]|nr:MAG: hypothetical protein A2Y36_02875 [Treponema sp. GWA1_62_8]OHE67415.1 MAG: hypothetical protein A2001_07360 [Treponema sp. GWC1_61_84]OHE69384.1 MAG: hypothetical protein A2413_08780 [Treponema sp. RIFOXYC1_FULL_61_9]HCM28351.1 hypothetical protein [Treponema sp.]